MTNVLVDKYGVQVAHDLAHINQNLCRILQVERNRLDVRVDLGPLLGTRSTPGVDRRIDTDLAGYLAPPGALRVPGYTSNYSLRH